MLRTCSCLLIFLAVSLSGWAYGTQQDSAKDALGFNELYLDRSVTPTKDFFRFANGGWLDQNSISPNQVSISAVSEARNRNAERVWNSISASLKDHANDPISPVQAIGQFIRIGLDKGLAERLRFDPIRSELKRIDGTQTHGDLVTELGRLHRWKIGAGFTVNIGIDYLHSKSRILNLLQGGLSLPQRDSYFQNDKVSVSLRKDLLRCIGKTFSLVGEDTEVAKANAERILEIEKRLAEASVPVSETGGVEQNFHRIRFEQLQTFDSGFDWIRYFEGLGLGSPSVVNVAQMNYLESFAQLFRHVKVKDWRIYLRWKFLSSVSPFLSSDFVEQSFKLKAACSGLERSPTRFDDLLDEMDSNFGVQLGQILCETQFSFDAKPKVLDIVSHVRASLKETIQASPWMAADTKVKACNKLDRLQVEVGYPTRWPDVSGLVLPDDSYVSNVLAARAFEFQRQLDGLSRPVDRREWEIRAYSADAKYDPSRNAIILPAGIMQPPYFDLKGGDASNYATLGMVIGHELMHALDGRGRKFDSNGNLNNWWPATDSYLYQERQDALVRQYGSYQSSTNWPVNGKQTLEENLADLGGLKVAYRAFHSLHSESKPNGPAATKIDQAFFLAYAQMFRGKARPEQEMLGITGDHHSPPKYRVNGVVRNMPEFWHAFGAEPPPDIISIWE